MKAAFRRLVELAEVRAHLRRRARVCQRVAAAAAVGGEELLAPSALAAAAAAARRGAAAAAGACFCSSTQTSNALGGTTRTNWRIVEWPMPHSSAQTTS